MLAPTTDIVETLPPSTPDRMSLHAQRQFVRDQFVGLFLKQNKRAQLGVILVATMVYMLLAYRVDGYLPLMWLALLCLVSGWRFAYTHRLIRASPVPERIIAALIFLNGVCLALPVLAFGQLADTDRSIISIALIALSTASTSTTSGYRGVFLWFAAPLLVALSLGWVVTANTSETPWDNRAAGFMVMWYLPFLVGLGRDAFRIFDESCRLRFAEQELNSQLASALDQAQLANKAKTRFLAAASHDLRQPLHTVGVLVAAISMRTLDARNREIVDLLGQVSQALSCQLDGLLDISKLDAGIVKPDLRIESISQLVQAHVAMTEAAAHAHGLYLRFHCEQSVQAYTDRGLLQRVLGNLTANALKFTLTGGVDVFVKRKGQQAIIEIQDSGIGIPETHQQLVFQEFYQIDNDERERSKGLGLGLSIVKRICSLLQIKLSLKSALGHGCHFTLCMPALDTTASPAQANNKVSPAKIFDLRVLVVDDEVDVRRSMRLLLEELGCEVLLADGLCEAKRQAQTGKLDMLISDFRLKGGASGLSVINQIRMTHPLIHVLLISGDTAPDRLRQAHAAGVTLLHKPVPIDVLLGHLNAAKGT